MQLGKRPDPGVEQKSAAELVRETTDSIIKTLAGNGEDTKRRRVIDNLVAFVGAAGGVGTSTLVANVAVALKKRGMQVLVIDTHIQYPTMHSFFGIKQEIEKKDLVSFLLGKNVIGESIENCNGISVMYANNRTLVDAATCDVAKCSDNMFQAIASVRELFDVILFDCGNDLGNDLVNVTLFQADSVYLVWNESLTCISNTDRMRRNMSMTGIEFSHKVRVVLNKRTNIHYSKRPIQELGLELVAVLPFDTSVIESGLRANIFLQHGESLSKNAAAFASGILGLAEKVLEVGGLDS